MCRRSFCVSLGVEGTNLGNKRHLDRMRSQMGLPRFTPLDQVRDRIMEQVCDGGELAVRKSPKRTARFVLYDDAERRPSEPDELGDFGR
jgi:hypothetical protein